MPKSSTGSNWTITILKLGNTPDGRKVFEGSFKDAYDFIEFMEKMPGKLGMKTNALQMTPKSLPYQIELKGPLVTLTIANGKVCTEIQ